MSEHHYLNYTHGLMLQSFCSDVIGRLLNNDILASHLQWLRDEQRNLRNSRSEFWGATISQLCYLKYLKQLSILLEGSPSVSEIKRVLEEIAPLTRSRIHVLFLTQEPSCWPSIESVFSAAMTSIDFEPSLVYTPFYHKNFQNQTDHFDYYRQMGLPVIRHTDYALAQDSPDIVYMIKPYGNTPDEYQFRELEKVVPRALYVPYGMEITLDLVKYGFQYYLHYKAWRHIVYGPIVKDYAKEYGFRNGENIAVWGHPKADHYRNDANNRESIPEEWKRIIGDRKTILWTPHHLVKLDGDGTGTWMIWGEKILRLALRSPDIVFIFRPHSLLMGALVNDGGVSRRKVTTIERKIRSAPNIIWDESPIYHNAVDAADAIITDGTTFCVEFLYTKKPIMLTPRNMKGFYLYKEMQESYYIANRIDDIRNYIHMIRDGQDPLYEKRLQLYRDTFFLPEKLTVGEHILMNVKKELTDECKIDFSFSLPKKRQIYKPTFCEITSSEFTASDLWPPHSSKAHSPPLPTSPGRN